MTNYEIRTVANKAVDAKVAKMNADRRRLVTFFGIVLQSMSMFVVAFGISLYQTDGAVAAAMPMCAAALMEIFGSVIAVMCSFSDDEVNLVPNFERRRMYNKVNREIRAREELRATLRKRTGVTV